MQTDQLTIMNKNITKLFIPITIHFNYHLIYLLINHKYSIYYH